MFRKIAVALDGSECAGEALDVALTLAKAECAEMAICSVVDPLVIVGTTPPSPATDQLLADREAEARRLIEAAVEKAHAAGLKAYGQVHLGLPSDEILRFAKKTGADAIVMGTHGRSGLNRLFSGSVAEAVLHGARCPVIVVREGAAKPVAS
ncbi:MAG: universal stress protein [Candidatus Eremiobacteraeota bacterium]|nr:universal stress protein [Candidatus Eremiobacteraeota bacterium]MBV8434075.1 universal stress protein [Candidatus Eremiobacteraeota bacterium]MBV8583501.1 universal stress protein [Candidatus Eremiobacteraeota bacterium]